MVIKTRGGATGNDQARSVWTGGFLRAILVTLFCLLVPKGLEACAMSALISREGYTLDEFAEADPRPEYWRYNDPWDYLAFVMANSTSNYNNDGYGVVAYSEGVPLLDGSRKWYKRVKLASDFNRVYYTGPYPGWDNAGQGNWDVLDWALDALKHGGLDPALVLCHARSASGHTYGNHPFTFETAGRTFSFMHNGWCGGARNLMIERIRALDPEWFKRHPSEFFGLDDPLLWVDSELLFHYLLAHVEASGEDVLTGLKKGLAGLKYQLEHPQSGIYNFVLTDGERLYLFRNTPQLGSGSGYKLSYKAHKGFYAARTLYPGGGDVELGPRELVVLARDRQPAHYPGFHLWPSPEGVAGAGRDGGETPRLAVSPNPFAVATELRITGKGGQAFEAGIYDLRGRKVWSSLGVLPEAGIRKIGWEGQDSEGKRLAAGIYLIRVRVGEQQVTGKLVLCK
ncbi:MAG: class II glutamine amidotransferase [Candidatus Cloacimonetes bacterium]|nr:class II glutamine amidotransferase [Candidatus Cloacimonadota bacterium]